MDLVGSGGGVVVVGDLPFYWDTEGKVSFEGYKLIVDGRRDVSEWGRE